MTSRRLGWIPFFVLAPGLSATVAAQDSADAQRRIREIYVPLEEFSRIADGRAECVLLSRQEYAALLASAAPQAASAPAPCAAALVSAVYVITVERERAEITGTLIVEAMDPGLQEVELEIDRAAVRRARLDDGPAPLARFRPDELKLLVEGVGRHELSLELTAPVETTAAQQTLSLRLPTPPATHITMSVPGNVEIKSGAAVASRVFDEAGQVTRFELIPQGYERPAGDPPDPARRSLRMPPGAGKGGLSLVMTLNNRLLQTQRAVTARALLVDEITTTYERVHATYLMTVLHQAVDRFQFAIPDGFDVTDVRSPLLSQWAVAAGPSQTILDVRLRQSIDDSVVIGISAQRVGGDPAAWSLPRLAPLDVVSDAAVVGLLLGDSLALQSLATDKLIPLDTRVITEALPDVMFGGEGGAPRLRAVAAYYSPAGSEGLDATGVFRRPAARLLATTTLLLTLDHGELSVQGGFSLRPVTDPLFAVEINVPQGWHVEAVTDAAGAALPFELRSPATGETAARLHVAFPGGVTHGGQGDVFIRAVHTPAGWLSKWDSFRIAFPGFSVRGAEREMGAIAVQSGDAMRVYPESVLGLTPLDDADKAEYGLTAVTDWRQAPAYRFERQPFDATFRVERVAPRVIARVYGFFHVEPHQLAVHHEVVFEVDRAETDTLTFSLPADSPADLSITGIEGVRVKETESVRVETRAVWTVHLAQARRGEVRLAVAFDQGLDVSQPAERALPMLRAEGVAYQSGVVAVEGSADIDVETMTALRRVDVGELAGAVYQGGTGFRHGSVEAGPGAAGGLDVFGYVGSDPAVSVRAARRRAYGLPTAIVQRAEMVTQVSSHGSAQTAVRLLFRTSAAFLELKLPPASGLWSAQVDGKPVQPQRKDDLLLLGLPAADRLLDVRMVYATAVSPVGLRGDVALASPRFSVRGADETNRLDVPAADVQWNVHLPAGYRLSDYAGMATAARRPPPELAAWSVAKWLWRCTGGINLFYHEFLPSLSRAREFSSRVLTAPNLVDAESEESQVLGLRLAPAQSSGPSASRLEDAASLSPPPPSTKLPTPSTQVEDKDGSSSKAGLPATPAARAYWALEGVRSLKIDLEPSGQVVAFRSLGAEPTLRLTLSDQRRMAALGWGLALAALLVGLTLTRLPLRTRARYVALVAAAATVAPVLFGGVEWTYLANPAFFAASLLVPYYAAVRGVRWVAANARRPIRFRAAAAGTTLGLVFVPATWGDPPKDLGTPENPVVVAMGKPLPPIELPDDAVLVPYDPAALGPDRAPKPGGQVLLPLTLFQSLWAAAQQAVQPTTDPARPSFQPGPRGTGFQPVTYAWAGGEFAATLAEDDDLVIEGRLEILLLTDGVVAVPLSFSDAVLTRAVLDGKPAQLACAAADDEGEAPEPAVAPFKLLVQGKGMHRLDLSASVHITREGGWRSAAGRIPGVPGAAWTLHVPGAGTEVRLEGVADRQNYETLVPGETIQTALGADGLLSIRWRPRIQEGFGDSSLTAVSEALLDVREDGLRLVWTLALDSGHSERDAYQLALPPDYVVYSISGPNVRGWNRSELDGQDVAAVSLLQPGKGTQTVTVVLHRPSAMASADVSEIQAPAVRVVGAALQRGRLTIRRSALLEVSALSAEGVARVDTPKAAEALVALADATASPLGMVVFQSYQFPSLPLVIQLSARRGAAEVSAEFQSVLRVGERRRTLETRLALHPLRQPVHQVSVSIPADLEIEQVEASGVFEWAVEDDENKVLTVRLASGQRAPFSIVLRGILGVEGPLERTALPVVSVIDATEVSGEVAIQTDPAFDLVVESASNVREIPLEQVYEWLAPPQRPLTRVALRHTGRDYEAVLHVIPRRPDVACTTISNVRITESTIEETLLLDFEITQTGIREITFTLPPELKDAVVLVPMLRHKTVEPLRDDPQSPLRVRLALQDDVMGQLRVLIENDRSLEAAPFTVPIATVETGRVLRQYLALESAGRDEVEVESRTDVEPLTRSRNEWRTLANLVGSPLTAAFIVTGDHPTLTLRTRERAMVETAGARIGWSRAVFVADAGGVYRATQSYRMDNRTEPYLEVIIPAGAELWSVHVGGQPISPAAAAGAGSTSSGAGARVRIPLLKSAAGDLDYEVEIRYAGRLPALGAWRSLDFPLLRSANVPVELSQVSLFLPDTFSWFDFGGTMRRVEDEAELAAGFVRYQTRLTERLGQTLEGDNPFARIRAASSMKEVESQTERIRRARSSYGYNAALEAELESHEAVAARAQAQQQQVQQQAAPTAESLDNRAKLDRLFENQQVARARNQVQELSGNFAAPAPAEDAKQTPPTFDREWLNLNALGYVESSEEDAGALIRRLDQGDSVQQRQAAEPQRPQFAPRAVEDASGAGEDGFADRSSPRGRRAAGTDERARQYGEKLEQTGGGPAAAGQAPARSGRQGAAGDVQPAALRGLRVEFPARGAAFHFTTPRGDVIVTARSLSRDFLARLSRLGLAALALAFFALIYGLATCFEPLRHLSRVGASMALALGAISLLTGVLPVVGALALIGGAAARRRLRATSPAVAG